MAIWIMKYEWRRREGPEVSKSDLDREIDEWMSQRGTFTTTEEMEQDLTTFMHKKGFDKEEREELDADMDKYWEMKGRLPQTDDDTDDTSTVTSVQTLGSRRAQDYDEQDLDNDLQGYLNKRGKTNSSCSITSAEENGMDTDEDGATPSAYSSLLVPKRTSCSRRRRG